jgi:hypothetical protein
LFQTAGFGGIFLFKKARTYGARLVAFAESFCFPRNFAMRSELVF